MNNDRCKKEKSNGSNLVKRKKNVELKVTGVLLDKEY